MLEMTLRPGGNSIPSCEPVHVFTMGSEKEEKNRQFEVES